MGGVCLGLSAHLGLPVKAVRLVMGLLALTGIGIALYVFLWVTVPSGDPALAAREGRPVQETRLVPRLRQGVSRVLVRDIVTGAILLSGAGLLVAVRFGVNVRTTWVIPVLIALGGTALAWSQLEGAERHRLLAGGRTPIGFLRVAGGVVLVLVGVLLLVGQGASTPVVLRAGVASVAVLAGVAIVVAPWWLRLGRELGDERAARAREAERADIAAHLHDSVLQTLALIRARARDPDTVTRLARAQERELRAWLYDDRPTPGMSVAAELKSLVGEIEDGRAAKTADLGPVAIETVVVGDCIPTPETTALLQAAREALVNAVAHGRPPVSVYLEVTEDAVEVFVRDRGDGFDIDAVAPDRFGVRESILGRVRRRGGTAEVASRPDWGTEVRLRVPRQTPPAASDGE